MLRVVSVVCSLLFFNLALAETPAKTPDQEFLLTAGFMLGQDVTVFRKNMKRLFQSLDLNEDDKISQADEDIKKQKGLAYRRSNLLQKWANMDLSGDGNVDQREMNIIFFSKAASSMSPMGIKLLPNKEQIKQVRNKLIKEALEADTNKDGIISFKEALHSANQTISQEKYKHRHRRGDLKIPLSLDKNNDNAVDLSELMQEVELLIRFIDKDKNGEISKAERRAFDDYRHKLRKRHR